MGSVHALRRDTATLGEACDAFLLTLAGPEAAGTRRVYSGVMRALRAEFGDAADPAAIAPLLAMARHPEGRSCR